jgi:DNA-directed RNA polymerase specialized sigma24 family protein
MRWDPDPGDVDTGERMADADPQRARPGGGAVMELRRMFTGLDEVKRTTLEMRYVRAMTNMEIGAALGVSEADAGRLLHDALEQLSAIVEAPVRAVMDGAAREHGGSGAMDDPSLARL